MFVYEHVPEGSLYDHLYSKFLVVLSFDPRKSELWMKSSSVFNAGNEPVDWRTRLNILQQVAQGKYNFHKPRLWL